MKKLVKNATICDTKISVILILLFACIVTMHAQSADTFKPNPYAITRVGNTYTYQGNTMHTQDFMNFLKNSECLPAYERFMSGNKCMTAGWCCFGVGMGSWIAGIMMMNFGSRSLPFDIGAGIVLGVGCASVISSVPLLAIGYDRMHQAANVYNVNCAQRVTGWWSLQADQNGIGLAYNF